MKTLKILLGVFVFTVVTASMGANARYLIYHISNAEVGGFNQGYSTPLVWVDTTVVGTPQKIVNVDVSGELDVRVEKFSDDRTKKIYTGPWRVLAKGKETSLDVSGVHNTQGGYFKLFIDSRWYYPTTTIIGSADWIFE